MTPEALRTNPVILGCSGHVQTIECSWCRNPEAPIEAAVEDAA